MVRQRQQFSDFMNWIQEKLRLRQNVMGTGHTLEELEHALRERRQVIKRLENKAEQCYTQEQKYRERADSATGIRKQTATLDAKSEYRERLRYEKIHRNLSLQQLFLRNLVEHVKEKRFAQNPMEELGLDIDIQTMNQEAVIDAINESSTELNEPIPDGLEEMQWALRNANDNTVTPDLDRLKDGLQTDSAADVDGEYSPNSELDDMLDDMVSDMTESEDGTGDSDFEEQ